MSEIYKYLYTQIGLSGSLPTYKVFSIGSGINTQAKWIFADNTFIYGGISDWALRHSGLDSGKPTWSEESKLFVENEKRKLALYKASHPDFITEIGIQAHLAIINGYI